MAISSTNDVYVIYKWWHESSGLDWNPHSLKRSFKVLKFMMYSNMNRNGPFKGNNSKFILGWF